LIFCVVVFSGKSFSKKYDPFSKIDLGCAQGTSSVRYYSWGIKGLMPVGEESRRSFEHALEKGLPLKKIKERDSMKMDLCVAHPSCDSNEQKVSISGHVANFVTKTDTFSLFDQFVLRFKPPRDLEEISSYVRRTFDLTRSKSTSKDLRNPDDGTACKEVVASYFSRRSAAKLTYTENTCYAALWEKKGRIFLPGVTFNEGMVMFSHFFAITSSFSYKENESLVYLVDGVGNEASLSRMADGIEFKWSIGAN